MEAHRDSRCARSDDVRRPAAHAPRGSIADNRELTRTVLAAAGNEAWAWASLMERFGGLVRSVARRHGLGAHDIDDVSQATWLRLFEHIGRLRDPAAIGGWLDTTARRESMRVLRRDRREPPTDIAIDGHEVVEPINERRLVAVERRRALLAGVNELPPRQRQLIGLMLHEGGPRYATISRSLGIPHGSIGPTRQRGLERLRQDETLVALCDGDGVGMPGGAQRRRASM